LLDVTSIATKKEIQQTLNINKKQTKAIHNQMCNPGADPGFQVRGAHLKESRRAEGGAKMFGVFRVKNHDYTTKNHIL
jgi:hypothetical protein